MQIWNLLTKEQQNVSSSSLFLTQQRVLSTTAKGEKIFIRVQSTKLLVYHILRMVDIARIPSLLYDNPKA
jgi:hypothetical protein